VSKIVLKATRALRPDRGATAIEYALLASLIAVVIIGAVTLVGQGLDGIFDTVANAF